MLWLAVSCGAAIGACPNVPSIEMMAASVQRLFESVMR